MASARLFDLHRRYRRQALLLAGASLALPCAAQAQETAQPAVEQAPGEIIVTAQRRAEALEDVPMTVAVLTSDSLEAAGVTSLRDIQNVTTGFQMGQGGAFPQPAIRGVTTVLNGTFENNVAVYVDGFYQTSAQAIGIDLPNVESIQVLKGPQGALYGRNATGGALLLNTQSPTDTWKAKAELTYARFDDKRASGFVAGPLSDSVGVSLAGYIRRSDGYHRFASRTVPGEVAGNRASPLDQDSVRAKLKFGLGERLSATVGYNYTHTRDGRGLLFTPIENVNPGYAARPGGTFLPNQLGVVAYDFGAFVDTKQHDGTLTLEYDTGIGTLRSLTGYTHFEPETEFDFDGSYVTAQNTLPGVAIAGSFSTSHFRQRTFQQGLDFTINAIDRVDLIVGATYFNDVQDSTPGGASTSYVIVPSDPAIAPPRSNLTKDLERSIYGKKEAWAAYADVTFRASDRLSLNVGGRYSEERQAQGTRWTRGAATVLPYVEASAKFSKFTPRASIRYEIARRTNIYASYSQGFRSGAFPTFPPNTVDTSTWTAAKQESVNAYEIGFKTAQNRLRAEIAGFYYDYQDLQVSTTQLVTGLPLTVIANVPKAKIYGVEASFDFTAFEGFTVRGGATWLHARFGDGAFIDGTGVNPLVQGINATNSDPLRNLVNVSQQRQNLSGLQLARAPDFTAFLGFDYFVRLSQGSLRMGANVKYTDSYVVTNPSVWCDPGARTNNANCGLIPADRQRQQRFREGAYALVNVSLTWTDPSEQYYLRVWSNNLTDHRYRLHYNGTANGTYAPMAEPRTYGVTAGWKL